MERKQFNVLIGAIILSAIILSVGIALQGGIYKCERLEISSDAFWFRLNKLTGEMNLMVFNREIRQFEKVKPLEKDKFGTIVK